MPKITVTTDTGELIDTIDVSEYDLGKPVAKSHLLIEIARLLRTAKLLEDELSKEQITPEEWSDA